MLLALTVIGCAKPPVVPDAHHKLQACTVGFQDRDWTYQWINQHRAKQKADALAVDPILERFAADHARVLATDQRLHHGRQGETLIARLRRFGLNRGAAGENLARLNASKLGVEYLTEQWLNNKTERENLKDTLFARMGAAAASDGQDCYFVLIFSD